MLTEARILRAEDIAVGLSAEFEREISEADVAEFARLSGDANPLHVDPAYAAGTGFGGRIVHGAFQMGLASALIGMHLPGRNVLLGSVNAKFIAPLYYPCRVTVRGEITAWNATEASGQVRVVVIDAGKRLPTAELTMGVLFHEARIPAARESAPVDTSRAGEKTILITGASGGIGSRLMRALASDYSIIGMVKSGSIDEDLKAHQTIREVRASLSQHDWPDRVKAALGPRHLYGAVHAAWPSAPHGGLLQADDEVIQEQVLFGSSRTVALARFLNSHTSPGGGRLIALGSVVGSHKPTIALGAYSLGKAALETTIKLLAPELARKQITINAVCPSFVPVGINKQANERQRRLQTAMVPMSRLCEPDDIIAAVAYLLSPAASFVSGQILNLTGGQL
jgi:NAD(P)-dependent dehydrogenase (short-subunit alcohol dehydrogenase family)/acyl dehydratase